MSIPAPQAETQSRPGLRGLGHAVLGTLILAGASTAADYAWALFGIRHTRTAGLVHGALIFMIAGAVLGAARDPQQQQDGVKGEPPSRITGAFLGAPVGILAGLAGAAAFYLLAGPFRSAGLGAATAMFPAYFAVWLILGLILKMLGRLQITAGAAIGRGLLAGLVAAVGFYFVFLLWTRHPSGALVYPMYFGAWSSAFLPGFLVLLLRRPAA